jgi:hypothetical protein
LLGTSARLVAGAIVLVIGAVIAVIVLIAPATTENFTSAGSTGQVQIPGTSTVHLQAMKYSFWYGVFVSGDVWNGTPAMTIDLGPPAGAPEPGFAWSDDGGSIEADNSQNLTLELVAYVLPTVAGAYRISVSSKDGAGGVILIGKTLASGPPDVVPALLVFAAAALIASVVVLVGPRRRVTS